MDQGFVDTAPLTNAGKTAGKNVAARVRMHEPIATPHAEQKTPGTYNGAGGSALGAVPSRTVQGLGRVESTMNYMGLAELGGLVAGIPMWMSRKANAPRVEKFFHDILVAPIQALRSTTLENPSYLLSYRKISADWADQSVAKLREAGKDTTAMEAIASKARAKVDVSEAKAAQWIAGAEKRGSSIFSPIRSGVKSLANGIESIPGIGSSIQWGVDKYASRRLNAHTNALLKAEETMTSPMPDFFVQVKNFFTGRKAAPIELHPELHEFSSHLMNAKAATTGAERIAHTQLAADALHSTSLRNAIATAPKDSKLGEQVEKLIAQIGKGSSAAESAHFLQSLEGNKLAGFLKSVSKSMGKLSIFGAVVVAGTSAAIVAKGLTHRQEEREANKLLNQLAADLGDSNAPLLKSIREEYDNGTWRRLGSSAAGAAGDVAGGVVWMAHGMGMGAFSTSLALPALSDALKSESPAVQAYAMLKAEDSGQVQLDGQQKRACVAQLIARLPDVKGKNGGIYNPLTVPVADAVVTKAENEHMSGADVIRLLANTAAFNALATDVAVKEKAAIEAKSQPSVTAALAAQAAQSTGGHMPEKPLATIGADRVHEGRIQHIQAKAALG